MWKKNSGRSSALSRAQAQLSGQRVAVKCTDELQEYMNMLNKKTSSLKLRDVPVGGLTDLSDVSLDTTDSVDIKENRFLKSALKQDAGVNENPSSGSRFLKKKGNVEQKQATAVGKAVASHDTKIVMPLPGDAPPKFRSSSAALSRLAQIENKIANRKLNINLPDTDTDLWTSDERPFSARSSSELSGRGSRFLKRKSPPASENVAAGAVQGGQPLKYQGLRPKRENKNVILDSDEEEIRMLIGSSLEYSEDDHIGFRKPASSRSPALHRKYLLGTPSRTPSPPTRRSSLKNLSRTPSPPSKGSPRRTPSRNRSPYRPPSTPTSPTSRGFLRQSQSTVHSLHRAASRSPPSSRNSPGRTPSPRVRFMKQTLTSLSERSDIKSLDELFSDASVAEDVISEDSIGSDGFRPNILSLDDLVPASLQPTERKSEAKLAKKTDKGREITAPSNKTKSIFHTSNSYTVADPLRPLDELGKKSVRDKDMVHESDTSEIQTEDETDVSEHLNGSVAASEQDRFSATAQGLSQANESVYSDYSDDFETSVGRTTSATAAKTESDSEKTRRSKPDDYDDSSLYSRSYKYSSSSTSSCGTPTESHKTAQKGREKQERKVTMKEMAVQTQIPGFAYSWSYDQGAAVLGPPLGGAYVDPVPIASHVVSPDAIEALTAYSPAVFALNDMLKHQLMLTQQFVQISRHLHASLLDSLEQETYHYTTLEETKEFITAHRPPPLTLDQAVKDVLQEMREYHYIT